MSIQFHRLTSLQGETYACTFMKEKDSVLGGWRRSFVALLTIALVGAPCYTAAGPAEVALAEEPDEAPLFRVFLKDGGSLASYGEFARVGDRVVFSMPTSASPDNPQLQLVNISADRVDWQQTEDYTDSARAKRYLATQAERDYALLTSEIAQALNDVALTGDAATRLAIVGRARKTLAEWPPSHFSYKQDDVRQMLGMLDEALADLRAATGAASFDLSFVAGVPAPKPLVPLLPAPTPKEAIEQTLAAARLAESAVERVSLLTVAVNALDRDIEVLPAEWIGRIKTSALADLAHEVQIDRAYQSLGSRMLKLATRHAEAADVRGVASLLSQIRVRDAAMGAARPDAVNALVAEVEARLDSARRLRLARDHWALRLPVIRRYRALIDSTLQGLTGLKQPLEDIKSLAGSGNGALAAARRSAAEILRTATNIVPPEECRGAHGLLVSAAQLAQSAALIRIEAVRASDMTRAWNASSAAAGALMLSVRAESEIQAVLRLPQLPR